MAAPPGRPSPTPIVAGLVVGCWSLPLAAIVATVFAPWAPPWLTRAAVLLTVASLAFVGARSVHPGFPFLVSVPYALLQAALDRGLWSEAQPTWKESMIRALVWLVPWYVGALAGWAARLRSIPDDGPSES
ncbi:MAG: hypothetical protein AAF682_04205 [Planctomycetota bacterium]